MIMLNLAGLNFIKKHESCRLQAYKCDAGVWTIGWGHIDGVREGDTCTQVQADAWLIQDIEDKEHDVLAAIEVPLSETQYAALVSFAFNLGSGALRRSTLLKKVNAGEDPSEEFRKWVYSKGKVSRGLVSRREAEIALYQEQKAPQTVA